MKKVHHGKQFSSGRNAFQEFQNKRNVRPLARALLKVSLESLYQINWTTKALKCKHSAPETVCSSCMFACNIWLQCN